MQASGLGTIGAAFLYLDALKRQAILTLLTQFKRPDSPLKSCNLETVKASYIIMEFH